MKEIFDWLREQISNKALPIAFRIIHQEGDFKINAGEQKAYLTALDLINEAEAKWEADCCEWKNVSCDNWKPSCETNSTYNVFGVAWFRRCPYCGKPIKISEVE